MEVKKLIRMLGKGGEPQPTPVDWDPNKSFNKYSLHYGVAVGNDIYEFTVVNPMKFAEMLRGSTVPGKVVINGSKMSDWTVAPLFTPFKTSATKQDIQRFLDNHKDETYNLTGNNCQSFSNALIAFLQTKAVLTVV